jgi:hypothetical protein
MSSLRISSVHFPACISCFAEALPGFCRFYPSFVGLVHRCFANLHHVKEPVFAALRLLFQVRVSGGSLNRFFSVPVWAGICSVFSS